LGNDRETIGFEKAGILRANKPAVCSDPNPPQSILQHAQQLGSKLYCLQRDFNYHKTKDGWTWQTDGKIIKLPNLNLYGDFQLQNAAGVLMVLDLLQLPIISNGLTNAHVAGRFQVLPGSITRIFDVAHNPLGAKVLAETLQQYAGKKPVHAILGMLNRKDVASFAKVMQDSIASWHVAPLNTPNTTTAQSLINSLISVGIKNITSYSSITNAYNNLSKTAKEGDIILVTGSFHTVAEVLENN
ncbi:MAG: bifunctional folylpolyglutamate synthase/dihydrofolate synthase, partial [Proteobacteria bacterium]|nr:bifunctional folylpolyglutamate synthase/dihydrofolate synthase [Pseudomonadota bacterium]